MARHVVDRQKLHAQIWAEPMTTVAKAYGITGTGLAKICRKLSVPVPPRGHWIKLRHGKPSPRTPLPPIKPGAVTEAEIHPPHGAPRDNPLPPDLQARLDAESMPENRILVADRLHRPHPAVAAAATVF